MIRRIIVFVCICSSIYGFQSSSFAIIGKSSKDLPKIYLSKNYVPLGVDTSFLANFKIELKKQDKPFSLISNIYFNNNIVEINELGLQYRVKSHDIIIGMINNKDFNTLDLNQHIVFGNNHKPLKRISIQSNSFIPLPFSHKINFLKNISFEYDFSNAILDENYMYIWDEYYDKKAREVFYSKAPRLHYKKLHFKYMINNRSWFVLGLNHAAIWGGTTINLHTNTEKKYSNSLNNLHKVIFWQGGREEYDRNDVVGGVIGNHLGSIDFEIHKPNLKLYYQHIFEDGGSFWFDNMLDGLWGVNIKNLNTKLMLDEISIQYLNTKYQSGNVHPDGVDSYFWHDQYPAGWQHEGVSLGSLYISPNQNRSKILFLSSRFRIKNNLLLDIHSSFGEIFHYYGYKGWNENIEEMFIDKYNGKYQAIYINLNSKIKNDFTIQYHFAIEKDIDISHSESLQRIINYDRNLFLGINIIKEFSL